MPRAKRSGVENNILTSKIAGPTIERQEGGQERRIEGRIS
jgi:hypothetical protein